MWVDETYLGRCYLMCNGDSPSTFAMTAIIIHVIAKRCYLLLSYSSYTTCQGIEGAGRYYPGRTPH